MIKPENEVSILKVRSKGYRSGLIMFFSRSEVTTFLLMVVLLALLMIAAPNYRNFGYIIKAVSRNVEFGLVALMMTFVIIAGQIDLSVTAIMTLSCTVTALFYTRVGISFWLALIIGLAIGFILGLINGVLISYLNLASIIVTIGTLALYRGISTIFIGDHSIGKFPKWFNSVDRVYLFKIGNAGIPVTIIGFLVIMIIMFLILKFTTIGRKVYAIGTNERVALFSGVNVKRFKMLLFGFSGLFSAAAGYLYISRVLVIRHDMALGGELDIITMVMLGGTNILGGRGNVIGTLWGLLIIVFVRSGLSVAHVQVDQQLFAIGLLLLIAIAVPDVVSILRDRYLTRKVKRELGKKSG
jgi:rhamnose transport system permease protein